jgi:hypothetical protein
MLFASSVLKTSGDPLSFSNIRITNNQTPQRGQNEPDLIVLNSKEKYKMIKNKIIAICLLSAIPLCFTIFTLSFPGWFYLNEHSMEFKLGLLYVHDIKNDNDTTYDWLIKFNSNENLQKKCYFFFSVGLVVFICLIVGVFFNLITIINLICMIYTNQIYKKMKKRRFLNLKYVEKLPGIAYLVGSALYLVSGLMQIEEDDHFIVCFYLASISGFIYLINSWFLFLAKKKLKRRRIVDKLLNIDGNDLLRSEFPTQDRLSTN